MSSLEFNKFAGAVLTAGIVFVGLGVVSDNLVHPNFTVCLSSGYSQEELLIRGMSVLIRKPQTGQVDADRSTRRT